MFAYCLNNPANGFDPGGTRFQDPNYRYYGGLTEYTDTGTGPEVLSVSAPSGATLIMCGGCITITANMTFEGPLDEDELINGIKTYWDGRYLYNGNQYYLTIVINKRAAPAPGVIAVYTDSGNGTSFTHPCWMTYKKNNNSITIFEHYESGAEKNVPWVMAHEFGHSLGVADFNGYIPRDSSQAYIMNNIGAHANNYELAMVIAAFLTGRYQEWG